MRSIYIVCLCIITLLAPLTSLSQENRPPNPQAGEIKIRAHLIHLGDINERDQTFYADFYLWLTWKPSSPAPTFEIINAVEIVKENDDEVKKLPNGELTRQLRVKGTFRSPFHLQKFPFDQQNLQIIFEDFELDEKQLRYVAAKKPLSSNEDIQLSDWASVSLSHTETHFQYPFTEEDLGDEPTYSRFIIEINIERQLSFYITRFFIPLFIIVGISFLIFFIRPYEIETRMGIGMTSMLTLIAFSYSINELLPRVSYVVFLDRIVMLSYFFVFFVIILALLETTYNNKKEREIAHAINRFGRVFCIVSIGLATMFTAWLTGLFDA